MTPVNIIDTVLSPELLGRLPEPLVEDIASLAAGYDAATIEALRDLVAGSGVHGSDFYPAAVQAYVHTAFVIAPVFTHFAPLLEANDLTFNPVTVLRETVGMLQEYWGFESDDLALACERRRNLARGVTLRHLLSPMETLVPSARLDVLLQFSGKNFLTLDDAESIGYILEEKCFDKFTDYLSGDRSEISYGHDHRMSFLTDEALEDFVQEVRDGMGDSGVYLSLEYWHFMRMRAERAGYIDDDDYPAWKLAYLLNSDIEMSHFGVVTMLADLDEELIQCLLVTCANFNMTEKRVVQLVVDWGTNNVGVVSYKDIGTMVERSAQVAPIIAKFYDAGDYEDDEAGNQTLTLTLENSYGTFCADEVDEELALGKLLINYVMWMRDWDTPSPLTSADDLRWLGRNAEALSHHAVALSQKCGYDREEYERMLDMPSLASGVL